MSDEGAEVDYQTQAARARRLASGTHDPVLQRLLLQLAEEYEALAKQKPSNAGKE